MTHKRFHTDILLKETLKKEDRIKIPTEENFYIKMQSNIMAAIVNSEVMKIDKWSKSWVFLEPTLDLNEGAVKLQHSEIKNKYSSN